MTLLDEDQRLKVELLTLGMAVAPSATEVLAGPDGNRPLTLAEYATTSGIALRFGEGLWVNVPLREHNPNFVGETPFILEYEQGAFYIHSPRRSAPVTPIPVPAYYDRTNAKGESHLDYGVTHTDRVRISPVEGCALACQFCDLPYEYRYRTKRTEGLLETVAVALDDSTLAARHVLISGGTPRPEDYEYENEAYEAVCRGFPGVEVDIMMVPAEGLIDPARLLAMGVHSLSINLEVYNETLAKRLMAGKVKVGSRDYYLSFIERAAGLFGPGRVRSLLLVGLETLEDTLCGVAALAERGCEPVLSPFRPDPSTPLRHHSPPSVDTLIEAYERSAEIASRYGMRLGPSCIPCQHNTLTFPDDSGYYRHDRGVFGVV